MTAYVFLFALLLPWCAAYQTMIDALSSDADGRFGLLLMHLQRARLVPFINGLDKGTLFAPTDAAFRALGDGPVSQQQLLYHLLPSLVPSMDLQHGQILETALVLNDTLQQRVKIQQKRLISFPPSDSHQKQHEKTKRRTWIDTRINDATLIEADVPVNRRSTIHVIDRVLTPPPLLPHVLDQADPRLHQLMAAAQREAFLSGNEEFTVFYAPRTPLMAAFPHVEQQYLTSPFGTHDLQHLVDYVIVPGTVFSSAWQNTSSTAYKTVHGDKLAIRDGKVNDHSKILATDRLAANGVLHELDRLPVAPDLVFDTQKYLHGLDASAWVAMLQKYDIDDHLAAHNLTFVVPTSMDPGAIPENNKRDWLQYHVLSGTHAPPQLIDGQLLRSSMASDALNGQVQRVPVRRIDTSLHFGESRVLDAVYVRDSETWIYRVASPLSLPMDVFTRLVIDLNLSTFVASLYISDLVQRVASTPGLTVLAPTNDVFRDLDLVAHYLLHPNGRHDLQASLQFHVLQGMYYYENEKGANNASSLAPNWIDAPSLLANHSVSLAIGNQSLMVDPAAHLKKDGRDGGGWTQTSQPATTISMNRLIRNGVVHTIDQFLMPSTLRHVVHGDILRTLDNSQRVLGWLEDDFVSNAHDDDKEKDDDDDDENDYLLLAPTDEAFAQLDRAWGTGWEKDTARYNRIKRLHVIPAARLRQGRPLLVDGFIEYGTLLDDDKIWLHLRSGSNRGSVRVAGDAGIGRFAHIVAQAHLHPYRQVVQIDTVLLPNTSSNTNWVVYGAFSLGTAVIIAIVAYMAWRLVQHCRRADYEPIDDRHDDNEHADQPNDHAIEPA
ncbi:hypothetical protein BC940DRAFT_313521 [Gongronella butleri]|nr:hypothetical protein BC940DRAFT_313521 [Gongronella butleri]